MKLNNNYEYKQQELPSINMMLGEEVEEYRGQQRGKGWNYPYLKHIPIHGHPPKKLCCTIKEPLGQQKQNILILQAATEQQVEPKNNIAQVHKINLCDILERRRLVAKAKGDEKLLSLLKDEWEYISCG